MQITCDGCEKKFKLPPEKVPSRRFFFTCPKCGHRITADPVGTDAPKTEELHAPAKQAPPAAEPTAEKSFGDDTLPVPAPTTEKAPAPATGSGSPLAALRPQDRQLLSRVAPAAYIVHLDVDEARGLGLADIHHFDTLEEATTTLHDAEAGLLLIRMERCPAPPCEPLAPLHALPFAIRRRTFVVLEAENVKTLNGQVAFFLQVNCLLNSQEPERFSAVVLRAMLHHLRLYQHWDLETD